MKKLLLAMGIGAGLAYLFDPDAGSRRRDMLRQKLDAKGLTGPKTAPSTARSSASYEPSYDQALTDDALTRDVVPPSVASVP